MTLQEFYNLLPAILTADQKIELTQNAYDDIVKKIRLHTSIHPVVIDQAANIGGFEYPIIINDSLSELCFKEIKYLYFTNITTTLVSDRTTNTALTGDIETLSTEYMGFTQEEFEALNEEWSIYPTIYNMNSKYIVTNSDEPVFIYMAGYVYPHFALSDNDPYTDYHTYTLENITDPTLYDVNPWLLAFVYFKAQSLYMNGKLNIMADSVQAKYVIDLINFYNQNERLKAGDNFAKIGLLSTEWTTP